MTILFLSRRFHPLIGGVEKHVMEVGKRLVKRGHRVIVVTEESPRVIRSIKGRTEGIEMIRVETGKDNWFKKFRIWKSLWKLREVIQSADIVHCHDVFFWYLPFRFLYPSKRVYTTFHGYESYPIRKSAIVVRKLSEKLSWGNICIGDFMKKWYGTKPDYVSYGAVALQPTTYNLQPRKESALFFGRLDEQTGVLQYVKAFEILKKKYPKFELFVIGDGEQKRLLSKKIKTIGFQKNPERYFKKYNFAFVSRYLSILEAMASRRLVVAVYDNPVKEDYLCMAPYAKFIIIESSPERIAKRIEEVLKNPKKEKEMVDKAYKWVSKQTWEEMVNLYLELWKEKG